MCELIQLSQKPKKVRSFIKEWKQHLIKSKQFLFQGQLIGVQQYILFHKQNYVIAHTFTSFLIFKECVNVSKITEKGLLIINCFFKKNQIFQKASTDLIRNDILKTINKKGYYSKYRPCFYIGKNGQLGISLILNVTEFISNEGSAFFTIFKKIIGEFINMAIFEVDKLADLTQIVPQKMRINLNKTNGYQNNEEKNNEEGKDNKIRLIKKYLNSWSFDRQIEITITTFQLNKVLNQNQKYIKFSHKSKYFNLQVNNLYCSVDSQFLRQETNELTLQQIEGFRQILKYPVPRETNKYENKFLYNFIKVVDEDKKLQIVQKSKTIQIKMGLIKFYYENNQSLRQNSFQNILQKRMFIKDFRNQVGQKKLSNEKRILQILSQSASPYLFKYYRVLNPQSPLKNSILVDASQRTLQDYFYHNHKSISTRTRIFFLCQVAHMLCFLHQKKIVHMKLNQSRIMVTRQLIIKIFDFTHAYLQEDPPQNYLPPIVMPYSAPQIFDQQYWKYNSNQDVYSFGILAYKILFNTQPFLLVSNLINFYKEKNYLQRLYFVPENVEFFTFRKIVNILLSLILKCLDPQPKNRPTVYWIVIILKQVMSYCINP